MIKFLMKMRLVFQEIAAKLRKNVISHSVKESFKKFTDPDPEAENLQNSISS